MSQPPQVSVVLPVYQGEKYLKACILSVLQQSFTDFELIIGDDGSTDKSREIIVSFKDDRIRLAEKGPADESGLFPHLNRLCKMAKGELVHILCQDDRLLSHCLETEVQFFDRHPRIGMSYCGTVFTDSESNVVDSVKSGQLPEELAPGLALQQFYYHGCLPGNLSTVCVRRGSLHSAGYFDDTYKISGDFEMWARICEFESLGVIGENLIELRRHEGQLSNQAGSWPYLIEENQRVRDFIFPLLPKEKQKAAKWYELYHVAVSDFHIFLVALLKGHLKVAYEVLKAQGFLRVLKAAPLWALTLNRRLLHVPPPWVMTPEEFQEQLDVYAMRDRLAGETHVTQ